MVLIAAAFLDALLIVDKAQMVFGRVCIMVDEKKRFHNVWARMDSDAEGEAVNAFMKVREFLRRDNNKFIRLLEVTEKNVPLEAYNALMSERDSAMASAQALGQKNAALANELNTLRGRLAQSGVVLGQGTRFEFYRSWSKGLFFGLALVLLPMNLGVNLSTGQWLGQAWDRISQLTASGPSQRVLQQIVERTAWAEGDTASHVYQLDGPTSTRMYWVKLRRWKTDQIRVNAANEPVTEYCTGVYAQQAEPDPKEPGLYEPPQEYDQSGDWDIVFHHAFDECVMKSAPAQPLEGRVASR